MASYIIRERDGMGQILGTLEADSIESAAQAWAKRQRKGVFASRVTGDVGKSGIWQMYRENPKRGACSTGTPFHVVPQ